MKSHDQFLVNNDSGTITLASSECTPQSFTKVDVMTNRKEQPPIRTSTRKNTFTIRSFVSERYIDIVARQPESTQCDLVFSVGIRLDSDIPATSPHPVVLMSQ
ncbi:hypothetical protein ElyMa_001059000 [Elysia marginata]|uniref:Uncharacterized protein n=1 Tax=Elysia marginata TaxID=1093978 RepID=A0AAV4HRV6_9GAST|nr:hypothetical protein ElyMa_001059000 [Elysia marginata]